MKQARRDLTDMLKVLCDPTRLQILEALAEGPVCVSVLADMSGISQPAVSQHLRVLRQAGLVTAEKRGYWVHYQMDCDALKTLFSQFEQVCGKLCKPPKSACTNTARCHKASRRGIAAHRKGEQKK